MPIIRTYEPGELALRPTETGVEARAATARRIGAFSNQLAGATRELGQETRRLGGETADLGSFQAHLTTQTGRQLASALQAGGDVVTDYLSHREISQGAKSGAELGSDLTDKWNNAVKGSDPNDPSIAGEFREKTLEPALDKFRQAFNTEKGQAWAEHYIERTRNHFTTTTDADMAKMAAQAVHQNTQETINSWTNTARKDPSAVPGLVNGADADIGSIVATSPNLKGADAARVRMQVAETAKQQIIHAGAIGIAEKAADPEKAVGTFIERWPQYINAQDGDKLVKTARYFRRLNESEDRAARVQSDYLAKQDFHRQLNELEAATIPEKPGDAPQLPPDYFDRLRKLSTHPGATLEPGRLKSMVTQAEAIAARLDKPEPLARVSHDTTMELLDAIRSRRMTTNDAIYGAYKDGRLNNADFKFLTGEFKDARTPEGERLGEIKQSFFKAVEPAINNALANPSFVASGLGKMRMYEFQMDAERKVAQYRAAGKDPHDLFDPTKPDYLGSAERIQAWQKPLQQQLPEMVPQRPAAGAQAAPAAPPARSGIEPRKEGESIDQWMERTGRVKLAPAPRAPAPPVSQ